jgi:branched-chain amino acid transport system substrate-binding protein
MAEYAYTELGLTTAAAIHDGDPYTEGLADVFRHSFEDKGGTIVEFTAVNKGDRIVNQSASVSGWST